MGLKTKKLAVTLFLSVFLVFALVGGAYAFSNVLAFGDSLSDNGTSANDPFGIMRFSNGEVWVEYLAQDLCAPLYDMAIGGATTGLNAPALVDAGIPAGADSYGLKWQVGAYYTNFYLNYGPIADDTLITISAGGNDMFNYADIPGSAIAAATNIGTALAGLIAMGGDAFMVMNLSPSQQPPEYQAWMAEFNAALAVNLGLLQSAYSAVDFYLLDMTQFVADVDNFSGTWLANSCDSPYANPETCSNETFAWYDEVGVHPTTQVHKQIAEYAMAQIPEPATMILLFTGLMGLVGVRRKR